MDSRSTNLNVRLLLVWYRLVFQKSNRVWHQQWNLGEVLSIKMCPEVKQNNCVKLLVSQWHMACIECTHNGKCICLNL